MRRVANVNGVLHYQEERKLRAITPSEKEGIAAESESGRILMRSMDKCSDLMKNIEDAQQKLQLSQTKNDSKLAKQLRLETEFRKQVYADCLAKVTCPELWNRYNYCWSNAVGLLSADQLRSWHQQGLLDIVCLKERHALEREIGSLVSNSMQAADFSKSDAEEWNDP
jgi:hypothetical protein